MIGSLIGKLLTINFKSHDGQTKKERTAVQRITKDYGGNKVGTHTGDVFTVGRDDNGQLVAIH